MNRQFLMKFMNLKILLCNNVVLFITNNKHLFIKYDIEYLGELIIALSLMDYLI